MRHYYLITRILVSSTILAVTLALGCGTTISPDAICEPGATQECLCVGSKPGVQVCNNIGAGWESCQCTGTTASGGSGGAATTSSGGAGGFGGSGGTSAPVDGAPEDDTLVEESGFDTSDLDPIPGDVGAGSLTCLGYPTPGTTVTQGKHLSTNAIDLDCSLGDNLKNPFPAEALVIAKTTKYTDRKCFASNSEYSSQCESLSACNNLIRLQTTIAGVTWKADILHISSSDLSVGDTVPPFGVLAKCSNIGWTCPSGGGDATHAHLAVYHGAPDAAWVYPGPLLSSDCQAIDGSCNGIQCTTPPGPCYNGTGSCVNGGCVYTKKVSGTACNDGNSCTSSDACDANGNCIGSGMQCNTPPGPCHDPAGTCNGAGGCTYTPKNQGTSCNDGNSCTSNDVCDGSGNCAGSGMQCNTPPGACYNSVGMCSAGNCTYTPKNQGTSCNDGNSCTSNDVCDGSGNCAGSGVQCNTPPGACYNSVGMCSAGSCTYTPKNSGTSCNDGNSCTSNDVCDGSGNCAGSGVQCNTPPGACYNSVGMCSAGSCTYTPKNSGTSCNDGNSCTSNDICDGSGNCAGSGVQCNTPPGACYNSVGMCSAGSCTYTPKNSGTSCNDGNSCTGPDTCNGAGTCGGAAIKSTSSLLTLSPSCAANGNNCNWTSAFAPNVNCTCNAANPSCRSLYRAAVVSISADQWHANLAFQKADGSTIPGGRVYWIVVSGTDSLDCGGLNVYAERLGPLTVPQDTTVLFVNNVPIWPTLASYNADPAAATKKLYLITDGAPTPNVKTWFQKDPLVFTKDCP